ncbi:MAG: SRPBCC domain-containing protein [Saprospiraceae bacterium]|uniref:SRPBCC domain-containing protein n=1 Tax=Candidatus Opimibacter skivensis TaxID=2982028 RepID=A0A9D7T065_9BACT|nr:SRPBCC domain-containing protein [Candidatus Opimibacter skivensis]
MKPIPIIIERTYPAPIEKVWTAITDKNEMKLWYFNLAEFKPKVGFEFTFVGGTEHQSYLHLCTITEVDVNKKLTHSWRYDGYEGISFVTWELFPEGENTRVRLTHSGLETFPASNPDFAKTNFEQGWTSILGTSLKEYLKKQ